MFHAAALHWVFYLRYNDICLCDCVIYIKKMQELHIKKKTLYETLSRT